MTSSVFMFCRGYEKVHAICISSRRQPTVGGPPAWELGGGLRTLPCKTQYLLRITTHSLGTGRITWHNLSPDIIRQVNSRRMRWTGHVARMGQERKVYKGLVGKPEGRPRRRWEDGIRMDLREIGLGGVDWIRLPQDRDWWRAVMSAVMNLRVLAPRS
jgi:hypothetical protein